MCADSGTFLFEEGTTICGARPSGNERREILHIVCFHSMPGARGVVHPPDAPGVWDKATIATGGCWRIHSKSKRGVIRYDGSLAGLTTTSNAATGGRTFDAIPQHEANQGNFQLQEGKWQPETPLKWVILIFQKWNICWNLSLTQYHLVVLPHRHAYNLNRVTSNRLIL